MDTFLCKASLKNLKFHNLRMYDSLALVPCVPSNYSFLYKLKLPLKFHGKRMKWCCFQTPGTEDIIADFGAQVQESRPFSCPKFWRGYIYLKKRGGGGGGGGRRGKCLHNNARR